MRWRPSRRSRYRARACINPVCTACPIPIQCGFDICALYGVRHVLHGLSCLQHRGPGSVYLRQGRERIVKWHYRQWGVVRGVSISKREVMGVRLRLESAISRLRMISGNHESVAYRQIMEEIIEMDLSPALERLDYLGEMAE